ncbi:hypothetical protein [Legionella parisiensis]|uniref:Uncharacterized protein n=1 Tax=Legionella parisiensis TaxID=45071 RepID=A0A1E5JPZ8_9GAMM|nr:hypothetical protein [Legionella parisiensis]KTD42924.1 hypothetical protein Lpar_0901 [Legionella parisiensis]OEH46595.1 hypothetical protein lpari_02382 [Legionella parisiensis]STX78002.1 Uncharacterised protein [Legionella parisiensis]
MTKSLTKEFRASLIYYLLNPYDVTNKKSLTESAFAIYKHVVSQYGMEPDKFMVHIDEMVGSAVRGIRVHPYLGEILDSFNRQLSRTENATAQAFHVLTLTYHLYLKNNLVSPEKTAQEQLVKLRAATQQLSGANPYAEKLESALEQLTRLVNEHFKLSAKIQFQQHEEFEKKLGEVCSEYKNAIENDAFVKSAFYSFLAAILNIFSLTDSAKTYQRKSMFFQEVSHTSQNTLSNFNIPCIEVESIHDELEYSMASSNLR